MPFCPDCKAEFKPAILECTDCQTLLLDQLEPCELNVAMGDVYACYGVLEATRIAGLLKEAGLDTLVRDLSLAPFPTNIGTALEQRVAVPSDKHDEALKLLQTAFDDEVLLQNGHFL